MPATMHPNAVTPEMRANELPDEFCVKGNKLHCKWCDKPLNSIRKDNLAEHLHSRMHQDNRMNSGAPMSFDPDSARMQRRRLMKKKAEARRKAGIYSSRSRKKKPNQQEELEQSDNTSSSSEESSASEEDLSQIFEHSDSEDTESFQGFDDFVTAPEKNRPNQKDGKGRKRPAHLDISGSRKRSSSSPKKKRKSRSSYEDSSPSSIPIHSMPLKKQMSYNARTSLSPTTSIKGSLKIKISRNSKQKSQSFHVESSETEDNDNVDNRQVTSYKGAGGGLKMKFVLNKQQNQSSTEETSPPKHKKKSKKHRSHSRHDQSYEEMHDNESLHYPISPEVQQQEYDPVIYEGVEDVVEEVVNNDGVEVVEEEIVGVDEGEVVSWDAVVGDDELPLDGDIRASPQIILEPELTSEETLAIKANYAREMAKAVNSAQFKKKKMVPKKVEPKMEEKDKKRKATGYMLWSSKMRKQVTIQFPGLQFGDVSKKLGDLWKRIPDKEKQMWKYRSEKMANQLEERHSASTKRNKGSKMIETGPKKKILSPSKRTPHAPPLTAFPPHKHPELTMQRELQKLPAPSLEPIDAAAHFHLLGQSLANIGEKVSNISSRDSVAFMPLLLDSLVCSLGPLLSLINKVPQLQGSVPDEDLADTFANIAHVMPGF